MGLNFRLSKSSYDPSYNICKGNPNPNRYSIIESIERNDFLLIKINYSDCLNYEGNKILLYKGVDLTSLLSQGSIDPHFSENKNYYSPIARFEPTDNGWNMALSIIER